MNKIKLLLATKNNLCKKQIKEYFESHEVIEIYEKDFGGDYDIIVCDEYVDNETCLFLLGNSFKELDFLLHEDCYLFFSPYNPNLIEFKAMEILREKLSFKNKRLEQLLLALGFCPSLKGCSFLKEAIRLVKTNSRIKDVYELIAKKHSSTVANVERSIRYAIEKSWLKANYDLIEEIFSYTIDPEKGKPSNEQFIRTMAKFTTVDKRP